MFFEDNEWKPASDVEMKVGVTRSASILSAGDDDTYTTDSTGMATAEFKKDSLPGDNQGNITLIAYLKIKFRLYWRNTMIRDHIYLHLR